MESLPQPVLDYLVQSMSPTAENAVWKMSAAGIAGSSLEILSDYYKPDLDLRLAPLAAASHRMRKTVEKQTFKRILLRSSELDRFAQLFSSVARRQALEQIDYVVELPEYTEQDKAQFETEADRDKNNRCFTAAIQGLFRILADWDDNQTRPGAVELSVRRVASPSDLPRRSPGFPDGTSTLGNNRFRYSYLELVDKDLPSLPMVGDFKKTTAASSGVSPGLSRNFSSATTLYLVSKFPCLRESWLHFDDDAQYPVQRRAQRTAVAEGLGDALSVSAASLQELRIHLHHKQAHHIGPLLDVTGNSKDNKSDPVSSAIFAATANSPSLEHLTVSGTLDASLFGSLEKNTLPFWQKLQTLSVTMDMTTPCGHWYFEGPTWGDSVDQVVPSTRISEEEMPPGYGDDATDSTPFDEHTAFRGLRPPPDCALSRPNDQRLEPLLAAFAKACGQMPELQTASIMCPGFRLETNRKGFASSPDSFAIWTLAPGSQVVRQQDPQFDLDVDKRRLYWGTKGWRPSDGVQDLFRGIGEGGELVEKEVQV